MFFWEFDFLGFGLLGGCLCCLFGICDHFFNEFFGLTNVLFASRLIVSSFKEKYFLFEMRGFPIEGLAML